MKTITSCLCAAVLLAAGCTTTEYEHLRPSPEEVAAYEAWKAKQPKIKFQPGTDIMGIAPSTVVFQDAPAPQPQAAPQPIIFAGGGGGTTIAQQVGNSTIVSRIGGWNRGTTIAQQVGNSTIVSQFGGYRPPIGGYARPYDTPAGVWSGR